MTLDLTDRDKNERPKYAYLDDTQELVCIDDITKDFRENHTFRCIHCNDNLIPVLGEQRIHHFRHKVNSNCSYESYLHKLGKIFFIKRFESGRPINVRVPQTVMCKEAENCPMFSSVEHNESCTKEVSNIKNIRRYYDKYKEEKVIDEFRADILLEESRGKNRPMLIEIYVTHSCSIKKLDSHLLIYEIKINNEDDAINILKADILWGVMYNANMKVSRERLSKTFDFYVFNLYKSGRYHIDKVPIRCDEDYKNKNYHSEFAILQYSYPQLSECYMEAVRNGFIVRSCYMCNCYKDNMIYGNICICYKKRRTPQTPHYLFANICPYFDMVKTEHKNELNVVHNVNDEESRNCMKHYKEEYGRDAMKVLVSFEKMFNSGLLSYMRKEIGITQFVNIKYDTCKRLINKDKNIYGLEFRQSADEKCIPLKIFFVRKDSYLSFANKRDKIIYFFFDTNIISNDALCIYNEYGKAEFVNFDNDITEQNNEPFGYFDPNDKIVDARPRMLERNPEFYQKILGTVLESFKKNYEEGNLVFEYNGEMINVKDKYQICHTRINEDTFYYALYFYSDNEHIKQDLIIRFVIKYEYTPLNLIDVQQIVVKLDCSDKNLLEKDCINMDSIELEYINF